MNIKITGKQPNSKLCFVCGLKNSLGLQAEFFETGHELIAFFKPKEEHQSYPGRLHGGIASTILDETIGRAIMIGRNEMIWGVTVELSVKFRKPVPLNQTLKVAVRITSENSRFFEGTGELILPDESIAVTATGKYMKQPIDKIADFDLTENEWRVNKKDSDPEYVILTRDADRSGS
jgi:acyl-coenzyme A thioesterase PaaI-like protein